MLPNSVFLIGRLCKPEMRTTSSGKSVLNARLEVVDDNNVAMIDVTFWATTAEYAEKHINLDSEPLVMVQGALRQNKWTSRDGEPRTKLYVKVYRFYVLTEDERRFVKVGNYRGDDE